MQLLSPSQLRAARGLLNWSRAELAARSGISEPTLHRYENGENAPKASTAKKLLAVFDEQGVEFIENQGVRYKKDSLETFEGAEQFDDFYDFLYEHLKRYGGEVCLSVVDEWLLAKYRKDPNVHYKRMKALCDKGIIKSFRILATKSKFAPTYSTYKWQPGPSLSPTAFYAFGDCLALISFVHNPAPYVVVIQSAPLAEAYRQAFNIAWTNAKDPKERPM